MVSFSPKALAALSDPELVQLYKQSGNQEALAAFYQRYSGLLFGTCMKYLKDPDKAADAAADIYTQLLDKLLKYEVDQPRPWLYMLTKNHCLQLLRKEKSRPETVFDETFMQSADDFTLDEVKERESQLNLMHHCIEQLKDEQKQTITLFYLDKKCYQDIAQVTGLDWNQVRSHIQNGRRNLKICMEKQYGGT